MSLLYEERSSDSPYVNLVTRGWTARAGSVIRPAESHWHLVLVRVQGLVLALAVGPLPRSGRAVWGADAEILWLRFELGVFMPHLPVTDLLDQETLLPSAAGRSFWLKGSAWEVPNFENADTFVNRLVRDEVLVYDPTINTALRDQLQPDALAPRTVRYRFLRSTGLTQTTIRQMQRAQQAEALLKQGVSILDTVDELGYFDQPHLTRALKQFVGYTPAQIARQTCHSVQDTPSRLDYPVLEIG